MSAPEGERRRIYPGLDQVLLRAMVVVGAMTTLVAAQATGAAPPAWQQWVVLALAVLTALRPESTAGAGLLLGAAYVWARVPETLSPLVLLAAAGMVLAHVSALVAAQGPARMRVDLVQLRRWALRGLLLWLAAATVWAISVGLGDLAPRRLAYALGLTLLIVLAVATTARLTPRPSDPRRWPG